MTTSADPVLDRLRGRVRTLMKGKYNQRELAARVGVKDAQMSEFLSGASGIRVGWLSRLADAFEVDVIELFADRDLIRSRFGLQWPPQRKSTQVGEHGPSTSSSPRSGVHADPDVLQDLFALAASVGELVAKYERRTARLETPSSARPITRKRKSAGNHRR